MTDDPRELRAVAAFRSFREQTERSGDRRLMIAYLEARGRVMDAERAAHVEAIAEGRSASDADVLRHYRRLFPGEPFPTITLLAEDRDATS